MSEKDQQKAAAVETAATGDRGGLSQAELDELVASSDTGGRSVSGLMGTLLLLVALAWSLFQLYIASPIGLFNDTLARSIHLGFAVFLGIMVFPATRTSFQVALGVIVPIVLAALFMVSTKDSTAVWWIPIPAAFVVATVLLGSPKNRIPIWEWALAIVGTFCALYLFIFYRDIANRVGAPILPDYIAGVTGLLILLEATRRALGPALMIVASVFLFYTVLGPYMPSIIAHKGNSLSEIVNHQWITTEGVFGIALGVSTSFVFLFVLFGSLLDRAGAGNYFIQVAFSLMGHMRGGPAKAAVVASAMTGLISGSSIANVVTTGTFTIPLMKKVGFNSEKAGAVEVASSVNGQIMPPVMGAAAFLMVEYVGIPYFDVVKHAFLPAVISYIALVYIVHLEAMKAGMQGLPRAYTPKPLVQQLIGIAFAIIAICALSFAVYYLMGWIRPAFPETAGYIIFVFLTAVYVGLLYVASKEEPLEMEDPNAEVTTLPMPGPTARSGLHFILPVVVLVWALMVDRLSPGLSAFWAAAYMIFILLTQRPLMAMFRGESQFVNDVKAGFLDLIDGLVTGARNMIGIGIATATAGIIVGAVSQTGVGSALADVVEVLSGGNILAILFLTAVLSLILGMGLPTTANYIVVSALLAPVIVTLGQQNGLIVPLIAVHLFVFYFGIMADVTPPVGLASFAAAAVSGGDPIRTGLVAFFYSLRTAALPFLFIFNTELLLIGVTWGQGLFIFVVATVAMLLFAAATQGFFLARNRFYETIALLLIAFTLFRPGFWMDMIYPPYSEEAPTEIVQAAEETPAGERLRLRISGVNDLGDPLEFVALLPIGEGETGAEKLEAAGLMFREDGDKMIIDDVLYDSPAQGAGLDWDQEVLRVLKPMPQPSKYWMFIPALLLLALVVFLQRGRAAQAPRKPATA
ncbi:TRAP transporter permease [Sulfitobacter sp. KE29]|uniref:TRAP transporter permease n=1 Tax=Sulfitobacter TaxID=60136 RepID=UPI0007C244C2|nr:MULTISPECIES: TRAP transporter permease [Sulfitobacter]KZY49287.1 C4-dicarboxylate ABC transporter [Sulfitobacter sp. HI0054]MBO9439355.1 TRAP transporter permease [Sulfitobacter sp. R18_2]MDF3417550.1 TRAP transporter permease [Sulfitobacter sp. Ks38]MDF3425032.1 TRAP transporter permease [Sulfitobacter sp. KE29]MDF3428613.1 TRAP transporter permease [Sulfitobacter sp. S46]